MEFKLDFLLSTVLVLVLYSIIITTTSIAANGAVFAVEYLDVPAGIASGDVTSDSVVLWSKSNSTSLMNIDYSLDPNFSNYTHQTILVDRTTEFSGHSKLNDLIANSTYYYKIWFSDILNSSKVSKTLLGQFKTAPLENAEEKITFAVGGDLGGQGFCRREEIGYFIFSVIKALKPDFFVANGDMIYADDTCPQGGPPGVKGWQNIPGLFPTVLNNSVDWNNISDVRPIYLAHWDYNKADKHYQNLYSNIPIYSQTDDHEVADNYDGNSSFYKEAFKNRTGYKNIVYEGLRSFFLYSPIESYSEDPHRIYRSFNWGLYADFFLLDSHQYRTTGSIAESSITNKTILGKSQLEWLKHSIRNSDTTWKIILNDVPVTIPHCFSDQKLNKSRCDNWATDNKSIATFTKERNDFMNYLDKNDIRNVIFIVTDVHHPANVLVDHDFDGDGDRLRFYELLSGPLSAKTNIPQPLDPTINATYLYKETGFFNFGFYEITKQADNKIHLISQIYTGDGLIRSNSILDIVAE
ncbi:MAG TPA: alkaline phosphatase D family protein [Candidatus Saccharimonadales bacterium]|nr:alkaline phosphatase D family protein [Candidatus Saccharimonadales bacterium]